MQNPLSICHSHHVPFLIGVNASGFPAVGRAFTRRSSARPAFDHVAPRQMSRVFTWLIGSPKPSAPLESEDISMFTTIFGSEHEKDSEESQPQLPFISWTERMSVDVKLLDNDHKKLAILITDLRDAVAADRDKQSLMQIFEEVVRHTRIHFAHEEKLFEETAYPDAAIHIQEHHQLMDRVKDLFVRFKFSTEKAGHLEIISLLKGWLFAHIQSSDLEYAPHLKAKSAVAAHAAWEKPVVARPRKAHGPHIVQGSWTV